MSKKMLHTKALIDKSAVTGNAEDGVIDMIVGSSSVIDRMGDTIDQNGWDLSNFKTNPVILWGHNAGFGEDRPPIGKSLKTWVQDKGKKTAKLMFKVQFDLQDNFAKEIFRKVKEGFINTVSVGFIPTEYEQIDPDNWMSGFKFLKQELLELSFVPVPANPEALVPMKSMALKDKRFTPVEHIEDMFPEIKDKKEMEGILKTQLESNVVSEEDTGKKEDVKEDAKKETEETEEVGTEPAKEDDKKDDVTDPKKTDDKKEDVKEEVKVEEEKVEEGKPEDEKKMTAEKVKGLLDQVNKAGRVLSAKNEAKIRQAVALLDEVLAVLSDDEEPEDDGTTTGGKENNHAKALEYKNLGTVVETEPWDGIGEMAKAKLEDVKEMCSYVESGKEEEKDAYKLPHHKAEGHKAVWRGVASSMALLMGAKGGSGIPKEFHKSVYDHLVEHYKEFNKEVPSFELVEKQALAGLDEELTAMALEREEKHITRLIKKVLDNQKQEQKKKEEVKKTEVIEVKSVTAEQQKRALEVLNLALSLFEDKSKKGGEK